MLRYIFTWKVSLMPIWLQQRKTQSYTMVPYLPYNWMKKMKLFFLNWISSTHHLLCHVGWSTTTATPLWMRRSTAWWVWFLQTESFCWRKPMASSWRWMKSETLPRTWVRIMKMVTKPTVASKLTLPTPNPNYTYKPNLHPETILNLTLLLNVTHTQPSLYI